MKGGGEEENMYVYRTERAAKIRRKTKGKKRKAKGLIREEKRSIKSNKKDRRKGEKTKKRHDNKEVGGVASLDKLSPPIPPATATETETKTVTASQVKTCALHAEEGDKKPDTQIALDMNGGDEKTGQKKEENIFKNHSVLRACLFLSALILLTFSL